jgi:ketosteroid isomerase-like protein
VEDGESDCRVAARRQGRGRSRGKPRLYGTFRKGALMSIESDLQRNDEQQILALHEAGDRALMSADLAVLARIFADDYVQYNEAGKAFTKQDVLNNFRTGAIRYPSIVSTGRKIRLFGDTAVVHGSESDEVEVNGTRFAVRYVYLDVLRKCDGEWKLVASQLARPMEE